MGPDPNIFEFSYSKSPTKIARRFIVREPCIYRTAGFGVLCEDVHRVPRRKDSAVRKKPKKERYGPTGAASELRIENVPLRLNPLLVLVRPALTRVVNA